MCLAVFKKPSIFTDKIFTFVMNFIVKVKIKAFVYPLARWQMPFKCFFFFFLFPGSIDEDVVVIEASSTPQVAANEEINVTSTDSEVEIVTVGESYR